MFYYILLYILLYILYTYNIRFNIYYTHTVYLFYYILLYIYYICFIYLNLSRSDQKELDIVKDQVDLYPLQILHLSPRCTTLLDPRSILHA